MTETPDIPAPETGEESTVTTQDEAPKPEFDWKKQARTNERDLKAAQKRLAEFETANATDLEKAVAKARAEAITEVTASVNSRLVSAEARALAAAEGFRNPSLAVKAIDLGEVAVTDSGDVDATALTSLLAELAKAEPYLLKSDDGPRRPAPDKAQGQAVGRVSGAALGIEEARKRGFIKDK
jgi:hypothetical protein